MSLEKIIFASFMTSFLYASPSLKIYNWTEYIDSELLKEFTSKTDIAVEYELYESNEELYEKLKKNNNYDIIFPSSSYIKTLKKENLIKKIDLQKLKNLKNINKYFLKNEELKNYALPYFWGTTSIIFNNKKVKIESLNDLWKSELKDKLFISNDMQDMFALSLNSLNYDVGTTNKEKIKEAYEKLIGLIPNIKGFNDDSEVLEVKFKNSDVYASIAYNGDISSLVADNKNLEFVYPKEGALVWVDTLAVSSKSKNDYMVYEFIDFIFEKSNAIKNAHTIGYLAAIEGYSENSSTFPKKEELERSKSLKNIDSAYDTYIFYWNSFLSELKNKKGVEVE